MTLKILNRERPQCPPSRSLGMASGLARSRKTRLELRPGRLADTALALLGNQVRPARERDPLFKVESPRSSELTNRNQDRYLGPG